MPAKATGKKGAPAMELEEQPVLATLGVTLRYYPTPGDTSLKARTWRGMY